MLSIATNYVVGTIQNFFRREEGADAIEYLLTIAVICVAVVAALALGLPGAVGDVVVAAIAAAVSCANGTTC